MPTYTFIMDYAGGTYISQVKAPSPKIAFVKGAQQLNPSLVTHLGAKTKESLVDQLKSDEPVPLDVVRNVWCETALIRGKGVLINLVQTEL